MQCPTLNLLNGRFHYTTMLQCYLAVIANVFFVLVPEHARFT
jgi:hypothetical protein